MTWRVFMLYALAMLGAAMLGALLGVRSQPPIPVRDLDVTTWYPWFSSAGKMEMINVAKEKHVDPKVIEQMVQRANHWEEPFEKAEKSK